MKPVSHTGIIGIVIYVDALIGFIPGHPNDTMEHADKAAAAAVQQCLSVLVVAMPV